MQDEGRVVRERRLRRDQLPRPRADEARGERAGRTPSVLVEGDDGDPPRRRDLLGRGAVARHDDDRRAEIPEEEVELRRREARVQWRGRERRTDPEEGDRGNRTVREDARDHVSARRAVSQQELAEPGDLPIELGVGQWFTARSFDCGRVRGRCCESAEQWVHGDHDCPPPPDPALPNSVRYGATMPRIAKGRDRVLTREDIAAETLRQFDGGTNAPSVRSVAAALGVTPSAIYYHFDSRAAFVQAAVELVWDEALRDFLALIPEPLAADPTEVLVTAGVVTRRTFDRHHRIAPFLAARPERSDLMLAVLDVLAGVFERLGVRADDAATSFSAYTSFTLGWVVFEREPTRGQRAARDRGERCRRARAASLDRPAVRDPGRDRRRRRRRRCGPQRGALRGRAAPSDPELLRPAALDNRTVISMVLDTVRYSGGAKGSEGSR